MDETFLSRINALASFRPAHVKVLLTSRPKQYLQRALKDPKVIRVSLEEELVIRDISVFVGQCAAGFSNDGINESMQNYIKNTVCKRSEGLYLYARLMLNQIGQSIKNKGHNEASIRDMIAKSPVGLEEMYNRVLLDHASLTNIHQDLQIIILQLVTQLARPMRHRNCQGYCIQSPSPRQGQRQQRYCQVWLWSTVGNHGRWSCTNSASLLHRISFGCQPYDP